MMVVVASPLKLTKRQRLLLERRRLAEGMETGLSTGTTTSGPSFYAALRTEQLTTSATVSTALGSTVTALVADAAALTRRDRAPQRGSWPTILISLPDAKIIRSLPRPRLGTILGAPVLAKVGDDPNRHAGAKSGRICAGTSPIIRASGKSHVVLPRHARNKRLADACYAWAFSAVNADAGARAFCGTPPKPATPTPRPCGQSRTD